MKYLALLEGLAVAPPTPEKGRDDSLTELTAPPRRDQLTKLTELTELPLPSPNDQLTEPTEPTEPLLSVLSVRDLGVSSPRASVTPNSRNPLIPDAVRTIIETIEGEARGLGWPPEILWGSAFWGSPRGLASVLDAGDEITEVTTDYIGITKSERSRLRFQRRVC